MPRSNRSKRLVRKTNKRAMLFRMMRMLSTFMTTVTRPTSRVNSSDIRVSSKRFISGRSPSPNNNSLYIFAFKFYYGGLNAASPGIRVSDFPFFQKFVSARFNLTGASLIVNSPVLVQAEQQSVTYYSTHFVNIRVHKLIVRFKLIGKFKFKRGRLMMCVYPFFDEGQLWYPSAQVQTVDGIEEMRLLDSPWSVERSPSAVSGPCSDELVLEFIPTIEMGYIGKFFDISKNFVSVALIIDSYYHQNAEINPGNDPWEFDQSDIDCNVSIEVDASLNGYEEHARQFTGQITDCFKNTNPVIYKAWDGQYIMNDMKTETVQGMPFIYGKAGMLL